MVDSIAQCICIFWFDMTFRPGETGICAAVNDDLQITAVLLRLDRWLLCSND